MARVIRRLQYQLELAETGLAPDFSAERTMARLYGPLVAGVDEAGRGPWAGPVVAAAAVLNLDCEVPQGLTDSKQVTEAQREALFEQIQSCAIGFGIGVATHEEIDQINIRQATHLAMRRAVAALSLSGTLPAAILIDGDDPPMMDVPTRALVRGDGRAFSIAAASILAKVTRDRMMVELDAAHPGYGFARHKGYGTVQHSQALLRLGPSPVHRASFAPVAAARESSRPQGSSD